MSNKGRPKKRQRLNIITNWQSRDGDIVDEEDGIIVETRNENGSIVQHYDTKVICEAQVMKSAPETHIAPTATAKKKVNNTTVRDSLRLLLYANQL